jgi:hypothetical protein
LKRLLIWLFGVIPLLVLGVSTPFFSALSNQALVMACIDPVYRSREKNKGPLVPLPPRLMCAYLTRVRSPDPNRWDRQRQKTLFGFTLAVFGTPRSERARELLEYFIDRGIEWEKPASGVLTPLHLAVFYQSEILTRRFLEAGANPRAPIVAPGRPIHGLDAYDLARFLYNSGGDQLANHQNEERLASLRRLERLLCDDPSVNTRADVTVMPTVSISHRTHRMLGYSAFAETYLYAADNAEQIPFGRDPTPLKEALDPLDDDGSNGLWGAIEGPLGDQKYTIFGLASVWDFMEFDIPCDPDPTNAPAPNPDPKGCALDIASLQRPTALEVNLGTKNRQAAPEAMDLIYTRIRLHSQRSRPEKPARLRRLQSVTVDDRDNDNAFEVTVRAEYMIGCYGEPYTEEFVLAINGSKVRRLNEESAEQ